MGPDSDKAKATIESLSSPSVSAQESSLMDLVVQKNDAREVAARITRQRRHELQTELGPIVRSRVFTALRYRVLANEHRHNLGPQTYDVTPDVMLNSIVNEQGLALCRSGLMLLDRRTNFVNHNRFCETPSSYLERRRDLKVSDIARGLETKVKDLARTLMGISIGDEAGEYDFDLSNRRVVALVTGSAAIRRQVEDRALDIDGLIHGLVALQDEPHLRKLRTELGRHGDVLCYQNGQPLTANDDFRDKRRFDSDHFHSGAIVGAWLALSAKGFCVDTRRVSHGDSVHWADFYRTRPLHRGPDMFESVWRWKQKILEAINRWGLNIEIVRSSFLQNHGNAWTLVERGTRSKS